MSTLALTHTLTGGTNENVNQVQTNFTDVRTWANGNVDDTNFLASAGMYTAYRTILAATSVLRVDAAAATFYLATGPLGAAVTGAAGNISPGSPGDIPPLVYFDDADYLISGRTQKLRLRAQVSTNATQPLITFTFGLYPVTFAGAADVLTATLGAVVASSTVAIASPAASSTTPGASADFTIPADGLYCLGVATSALLTNNNISLLSAQLQTHWV